MAENDCKGCKHNKYKPLKSNTLCQSCPNKSQPNTKRSKCYCSEDYYRLPQDSSSVPCRVLPDGPALANATAWNMSTIILNWIPPGASNYNITFTIACFKCTDPEDKKCVVQCGNEVTFSPGKSNLKVTNASVSGLVPGTSYMFKVYSVIDVNAAADVDKWKHVKAFATTKKGETVEPDVSHPTSSPLSTPVLIAAITVPVVVFVIICAFIAVLIIRRRLLVIMNEQSSNQKKESNRRLELQDKANANFVHPNSKGKAGDGPSVLNVSGQINYGESKGENYEEIDEIQSPESYEKTKDDWEVPRQYVQLMCLLGTGNFGQVHKAFLKDGTIAAVKMLKKNASEKDKTDMEKELQMLKHIKNHPHVVSLLGCCTRDEPMMLILEYLPYGDLLGFLRKSRGYKDVYNTGEKTPTSSLSSRQLMEFAWMIADGMSYLAEMNCVHRDLAARNVLVGEDLICKISDFGLARGLSEDVYIRHAQARLPAKWMPLESLLFGESTIMSDVWSYGIVLWEIFSIGGSPYPGVKGKEIVALLDSGYRMEKPNHISQELYSIMVECWAKVPQERPTFQWLRKAMKRLLDDRKEYINLQVYNDELYVNFDMV